MTQYSEQWWFANGVIAADQRAAVFGPGDTNTFAPIFADPGLTVPLSNPTTTDALGILTFYAPNGQYFIFVGPEATGDSVEINLGAAPGAVDSVNGQTGNVVLGAADVGADPVGSAAAAAAASQPIATINAKGDLYAGTGPDATARQPVGADGEVLTADSSSPTGLIWSAAGGGAVDSVNGQTGVVVLAAADVGADVAGAAAAAAAASQPISTINAKGDLYAGTANDATARLPVGADGRVLTADSGQPTGLTWALVPSAPVTSVNGQTGAVVLTAANVGADPAGSAAAAAAASQALATVTTKGDLYAATANATTTRQPVGTDGQVLTADSAQTTGMKWATPTAAPVTSVNGQTGVVMLTAANVGADPAGSAAAAAAASQPLATIDAKGDLYAGTGADATTRLPVGTDGQVLTADSGQATGLAWTTPAAAPVTSVNGQTGVVVLTAANVGAQPIATITTKGDLYVGTASATVVRRGVGTDGQVLTADSSQTDGVKWAAAPVDAGAQQRSTLTTKGDLYVATASATTARQGVGADGQVLTADSTQTNGVKWAVATDTGAVQKSTVTTKGDLIVATASATVARQGVGSDGQVLVADSTQTNGIAWAIRASVGIYPRSTGYSPAGMVGTVRSSKGATLNTMFLTPVYLLVGATLSSIAFEVSGNVATAVARLGIYGSSASMLPTGAPIADYGTTTADTTASKAVAVSTVLAPGLYWIAIVGQTAAPTLRFCAGQSPWVASATFPTGSGVGWNNAYAQTGVTGALPSIGTLADSDAPLIGLKF